MKAIITPFIILNILILFSTSCIDRNMPLKYEYNFSIVDSNGVNLVGDTINRKRYDLDSIKCYSADGNYSLIEDFPPLRYLDGLDGYIFGVPTRANLTHEYIIKYNGSSFEKDTIRVNYGKNDINVHRNNQLIFQKEDISQTTEIHFKIIK